MLIRKTIGTLVGGPVEDYLAKEAKQIIKPRWFTASEAHMEHFRNTIVPSKSIETLSVPTEDRVLTAHKFQLKGSKDETAVKKAIIYITGNCHYVAGSLPGTEDLLQDMAKDAKQFQVNARVAIFCQDYRGRGFNQKDSAENFNDYSLLQDSRDQAALIATVAKEGYKPEDILVLGYSYGSAVGLGAVLELIKKFGEQFLNIKFYSDRGFGNLFDFRYLNLLVADPIKAHAKLHKTEMMPESTLHDIAASLPASFVFRVKNDKNILPEISLAETIQETELPGRVWTGESFSSFDPHLADHEFLRMEFFNELQPHHFISAMLNEHSIPFSSSCDLPLALKDKNFSGYALKQSAMPGDTDFVEWRPGLHPAETKNCSVVTDAPTKLVQRLHEYCEARAKRATESELGGSYNKAWFGSTGLIGWTAKQQVEMAVKLMRLLHREKGPDWEAIKSLTKTSGPHLSGELNTIFVDMVNFVKEYEQLKAFNDWVGNMSAQREKAAKEFAQLASEWELVKEESDKTVCAIRSPRSA